MGRAAYGGPDGGLHPVRMEAYRDYLYGLGLSEKTVRLYLRKLEQAADWCRERGTTLLDVTATDLVDMCRIWPNSSATRTQVRTMLKHYWAMTGREDPPLPAVRVPPEPRGRCMAVTPEQARALVKTSLGWQPAGTAVLLGLYLALRAGEIAGARWSRFTSDGWYRVQGKGDVTAEIPVHPVLAEELEQLRRFGDWVFPGERQRQHVAAATVWNWTQSVAEAAGVGHIRVHDLRHTAIATVHDSTGDLRAASVFARHVKLQTTARYTRTSAARLVEAVNSLDYLGMRVLPAAAAFGL